jgi:hypothetical protein
MKKLILQLLLLLFIKHNSIIFASPYTTNIGPIQLITTNGINTFSPGTINLYGNINIGHSNNDVISFQGSDIIKPSVGNNIFLMLNSSGHVTTSNTTNSSLTCGSFSAALNSGQTILLGNNASTGNYITLTSNSGDIIIQSNITNGNILLNALFNKGNIVFNATRIDTTANSEPSCTILAIDRDGNVITSNLTNLFILGSDTNNENYIKIDNDNINNGIELKSYSVNIISNPGHINLSSSGIIYPTANEYKLLTIDSFGNVITNNVINSPFTCDTLTTNTVYSGNLIAGSCQGDSVILGNPLGNVLISASGISNPSLGQYNTLYIDSNGSLKTQNSSQVYKENIQKLEISDDYFNLLKPSSFNYINDQYKQIKYGLIAEDLINIPVIKDAIIYDTEGSPLSIDYQMILFLFLSHYLSQKSKINSNIENLIQKNQELEEKINKLVKKINSLSI